MIEVSPNYSISEFRDHKILLLKKGRKVSKAGFTAHIYLPNELEGEEIIGVVVK